MKGFVIVILLLVTVSVKAQQIPLYSQYTFNRFALNPAYAGNKNRIESILTHRNHLVSFPGAPTTQHISVSAPIQAKYLGLGMRILNDQLGVSKQIAATFAANYFIGFGGGRLAMGLEFGLHNYSMDWAALDKKDDNDAVLPLSRQSVLVPDGGFGIFYNSEMFYGGYSVQHMIRSKLYFEDVEYDRNAKLYMHHYLNFGGVFELNDLIQIEPHMLLKMVKAAPWQLDIGGYAVYKNMAGAGIAYRTGDAVYFTSKVEIKEQFYIGYSYGIRVNSLSTYSSNSHEVMVGYFYKLLEPARKKIIHPRYYF